MVVLGDFLITQKERSSVKLNNKIKELEGGAERPLDRRPSLSIYARARKDLPPLEEEGIKWIPKAPTERSF